MLWAFKAMMNSRLKISPEPHQHAGLITYGPYQYIRHPMYTSIVICCAGLLISHFSFARLLFFLALVTVLLIKSSYEEKLLNHKFPEYKKYTEKTKRLVPFLF
jgi:protein-S-isoprenylcysteine O-methyltransferase Ste14